jgi:hypothetical protein
LEEDDEDVEAVLEMASARRGAAGSGDATVRLRRIHTVVFTEKQKSKGKKRWRREGEGCV